MSGRRLLDLRDSDSVLVGYVFRCPGCRDHHSFYVSRPNASGATWQFNHNVELPTFTPSLLVRSGHYVDGKHPCWCDYRRENPEKKNAPECYQCHSFVTDGRIQFLGDCSHSLKGQTVELPLFEEELSGA